MHWGGRDVLMRHYLLTYVDTLFIRSAEKDAYESRLELTVQISLEFTDTTPATHGLGYVEFSRPLDSLHFLSNFEY